MDKAIRRAERERRLADRIASFPTKRYGVIYADPGWRFEPWSRETGMDRAADNHYPTQQLRDIMALPVADIAAPDCTLFLWATAPLLPEAILVLVAWGFAYRTNFVWDKVKPGTGYWNRNRHEHLLVGVKGNVPAPSPGTQWESLLTDIRRRHSAKPDLFAAMIEALFPRLPKIELYRRGDPRPGWDAWGADVDDGVPRLF